MNTDGMEGEGEICKSPLVWCFTPLSPDTSGKPVGQAAVNDQWNLASQLSWSV